MELQDLKNLHEKEEPAKGLDIYEIITPYIHRWKQFLLTFIICLAIGIVYYLCTPKTYQVSSALKLIDQTESKGLGAITSQMSALSLFTGGSTNVDNELAIFRSKTIQKKAIIDLNLYVTYKGYEDWKNKDIYTESPYKVVVVDTEKADKLSNSILFEFEKKGEGYILHYTDNEIDKDVHVSNTIIELNTQELGKVVIFPRDNSTWKHNFTAEITSPRLKAIDYNDELQVSTTTKSSSIVILSNPTENIQKAIDFHNEILRDYNDYSEQQKKLEANATLSFVKDRLSEIAKELSTIEKDVETYKLDNDILDLTLEAKASVEQNYETQIKLNEIETQKILLNYVSEYLSKQNNVETIVPSLGILDQGILTMIAEHNSLILLAQDLKSQVQSGNKSYLDLKAKINNSAAAIRESIRNLQKGINLSISEFKKIEDEYLSKKKKMPVQEREFYDIKRRQKITETIYLFLSQKCEESILNLAIGMPKASFIESPDAEKKHIAPRGSLVLLMVMAVSLLLPIGFHLCRDAINNLRKKSSN